MSMTVKRKLLILAICKFLSTQQENTTEVKIIDNNIKHRFLIKLKLLIKLKDSTVFSNHGTFKYF